MNWRQVNGRGCDLESTVGCWYARRFFGAERWAVGLWPGLATAGGWQPPVGEGDTPDAALADWVAKTREMVNRLRVLADFADDLNAGDAPGKD